MNVAACRSLARVAAATTQKSAVSFEHNLCRTQLMGGGNAGTHHLNGKQNLALLRRNLSNTTGKSAEKEAVESAAKNATKLAEKETVESASKQAAETSTSKPASDASASDSAPLGKTFVAMLAGVATVMGFSYATEVATASDAPPFDPSGQRFDQTTFQGRFCRMLLACDPTLLFYSEETARKYGDMVKNYKQLISNPAEVGETAETIHHALWEAQRISGASLNEGTVVPHPFRMSGYVPFNGPICVAMVASKTTPAILFWSWVNQSQNALVNYFNRNASSPMDNETLAKSYGIAVTSALTVAFGLATFIQKR